MEKEVIIGRDVQTGEEIAIDEEARSRFTYALGITGSGKSNVAKCVAYQDMLNGDGLGALDPHEDMVRSLLACIPAAREKDVILWDPTDTAAPFGCNPLDTADPKDKLTVTRKAENLIAALSSVQEFSEIFAAAPRLKDLLQHLGITLIVNRGHTLVEAQRFLSDRRYRSQFYPALTQFGYGQVRAFWEDEFDARSERDQRELYESTINKLRRFSNPVLQGIFGQPHSSIDLRRVMDEGKILLVPLSAAKLGQDNAALLGAFIVWEILQAALSRVELPPEKRRPFHLFADEFQLYATTAFPQLLAEARKFGLDAFIAHQVREQLDPRIQEITRGVGNLIIFRVTAPNAASLAAEFDTTPPPADLVPQVVTHPAYVFHSEARWISKEAETEYKRVGITLGRLLAELGILDFLFHPVEYVENDLYQSHRYSRRYMYSLDYMLTHDTPDILLDTTNEAWERHHRLALWSRVGGSGRGLPPGIWTPGCDWAQAWWTEPELSLDICRQLNPDYRDEKVMQYVKGQIYLPNSFQLRKPGRQLHRFPVSLASTAELRLEALSRGEWRAWDGAWRRDSSYLKPEKAELQGIASSFAEEFLAVFLPLKEKASYWYDPDHKPRQAYESGYEQFQLGWWEITLFPAVQAWMKCKARELCEKIAPLEKPYREAGKGFIKEQKERYLGYDLPSKTEDGTVMYRRVPGAPRPRSDVQAEIANALVSLPAYQARCKLFQSHGRPTEHTIQTLPFRAEQDEGRAKRIQERSRSLYGCARVEVERCIEERLLVRSTSAQNGSYRTRETTDDEYITFGDEKTPGETTEGEDE